MDRLGIVAVVLLTAVGCHSSGGGGTPDGTGGASGQTGTDGAAGDRAGAGGGNLRDGAADGKAEAGSGLGGCLGVCLETFYAQCSKLAQSCTTATAANGQVNNCYANGVKQAQVQSNGTTTTVVQTADGHTCYESDLTGTTEIIKDLDGKMIAQIVHTSATQLTVDCYGADGSVAANQVNLAGIACAAYSASAAETCTAGTCNF
jgi:hypothetical protein